MSDNPDVFDLSSIAKVIAEEWTDDTFSTADNDKTAELRSIEADFLKCYDPIPDVQDEEKCRDEDDVEENDQRERDSHKTYRNHVQVDVFLPHRPHLQNFLDLVSLSVLMMNL